jgi:ElaB/YqjD/DUF883 family membrane-anchored ribosome-binding protein
MNKHISEAEDVIENLRDKAGKVMRSADQVVHKSPYKALGVALGVGAVIGLYLAGRRASKKAE